MGVFIPLGFIVTRHARDTAWVPPPGFLNPKLYPIVSTK